VQAGGENRQGAGADAPAYALETLQLTDFRNYRRLSLEVSHAPVALCGANGAGKTNLLEALSFLVPGRGLRAAPYDEITREGARGGWAVFARVSGPHGLAGIGTGLGESAAAGEAGRAGREVRIDGTRARSVNELASLCRMVWLTPSMDQLFSGPASDRRRFLDRLVVALDPGHRSRISAFESAMRQRNALLETGAAGGNGRWLDAIEAQMAEHAAAVAAARRDCVRLLQGVLAARAGLGLIPQVELALEGSLETHLEAMAAVDAEDTYRARLGASRGLDAAAGRTLEGPHRSDLIVFHGPKARAARSCSTGEQKILLAGIVLAHARLVREVTAGATPLLLLDEVAAHLDAAHRAALFGEIEELGAQAWMTGTDEGIFAAAGIAMQRYHVGAGGLERRG